MWEGLLAYASRLVQTAVCLWLVCWGVRRKYELDYKLDSRTQKTRWAIISVCFLCAMLQGDEFKWLRILSGIIGLGFVAWPNLAYHLVSLVSRSQDGTETRR